MPFRDTLSIRVQLPYQYLSLFPPNSLKRFNRVKSGRENSDSDAEESAAVNEENEKKNNGTFKKCFAQRLRELRKENGITQAGLAERMNVSRTCIANWESSERIPEVAAITYLAKLFKVPVDYLCGRTDERYRVKLLDNIDFDLTKLNGKGIEMLCEYYDYLVSSEKYRAK